MPHVVIDTPAGDTGIHVPSPRTGVPKAEWCAMLYGTALLAQGYTPDQAAEYMRRAQRRREPMPCADELAVPVT